MRLMQERQQLEEMQTMYSYDMDYYRYLQRQMDNLDMQMDQIRWQVRGDANANG